MSRGVSQSWDQIPTLVLGNIYEYLLQRDRLNASQTCRHWRGVLFQKRFFNNFKFKLNINNERQCIFFRQTICNLAKEVTIKFDYLNIYHIMKVKGILYKIVRCENLQGLHFSTNAINITPTGDKTPESRASIEECFIVPLQKFLNRKRFPCQILNLGSIESLGSYGVEMLKALGSPEALEQLILASIKYNSKEYEVLYIEPALLQRCSSLQVLSLDYDSVKEDLLNALERVPLKKFLICIHSLHRQHPGISDTCWASFGAIFPNVDLIVTVLYSPEVAEVLHVRILRQHMPITHLRMLFCEYMNLEALDWMSINNSNTLKSVQWLDSAFKDANNTFMDIFLRSGQDPLVMMAWRCKNLEEIVIHGYVLDPHNIVGISRLRGQTLKRLEISMIDRTPTEASMESFIEEINTLIGQKWAPLNPNNLHPALGYMQASEDIRDDYVFDLIRRDLGY